MIIFTRKTMYKFLFNISLSVAITPFADLFSRIFQKYIFCDWEFLGFLFVLIMVDTVLGVMKHVKHGTVSSAAWGKIINKLILYMAVLILSHNLGQFTIHGEEVAMLDWFGRVALISLIVRESISILENIGSLDDRVIPTWLLNKLKEFDSRGKFNKGQ